MGRLRTVRSYHVRALLMMTALLLPGCGADEVLRELEVAPFKAGCTGVGPTLCLQVREDPGADFQNLYETPDGFEYEWGYSYVIVVAERRRDELLADASSITRRLDGVVSRTPVSPGTTFELVLAAEGLRPLGDSRFGLFSESVELTCSEGANCLELEDAALGEAYLRLTVAFGDEPTASMEILAWEPCSGPSGPC